MADDEEEILEVVDEHGRVVGREKRSAAHRLGLLHRSVYVWVFDPQGRVLLQQRSAAKQMEPGCWDLSAAEHMKPGETYPEAALRGLEEELGIVGVQIEQLAGPLAPSRCSVFRQGDFCDRELVQSFRLDGYAGAVAPSAAEVAATRYVDPGKLRADVAVHPERYTQWMREEGEALGWFQPG